MFPNPSLLFISRKWIVNKICCFWMISSDITKKKRRIYMFIVYWVKFFGKTVIISFVKLLILFNSFVIIVKSFFLLLFNLNNFFCFVFVFFFIYLTSKSFSKLIHCRILLQIHPHSLNSVLNLVTLCEFL